MDELVQQLSEGEHPVTVGGPRPSLTEFHARLDKMEYAFIRFTDTRGGTDLGVRIDRGATHFSSAQFEQGTGTVHLEGTVTLNYTKVRCVSDIDLATLHGTGHLVLLENHSMQ